MIQLDRDKKVPLYEQLYKEIKKNILSGEYGIDYRLPAIRNLAKELHISHNTVNRAYQQLLAEGYIHATQGSGFYVEELYLNADTKRKILKKADHSPKDVIEPQYAIQYDFSRSGFANEGFSWNKWSRYIQNALTDSAYKSVIKECPNKGSLELREEVCSYIKKIRGVECDKHQIIICPTSEQGMEIIMNILPKEHYTVGIEEPSSEKMRRILINKGFYLKPIPLTAQGLDVTYLEKTDCDLLYITPSFQFPTGVTLPLVKRLQLLEWCRRTDAYIIENDYESEFLFGSQPIASIHAWDRKDKVIYIGTFSNIMTPEIKISFVVLPKPLILRFEDKYAYYRSLIPDYIQSAMTEYIKDGQLERQSRKMAVLNQRKKKIFLDYVSKNMGDIVKCHSASPGTHCLIEIYDCKDSGLMINELGYHGIQICSTREYWYDEMQAGENVFLISFSCIYEKDMEKACRFFEQELRSILGIPGP